MGMNFAVSARTNWNFEFAQTAKNIQKQSSQNRWKEMSTFVENVYLRLLLFS